MPVKRRLLDTTRLTVKRGELTCLVLKLANSVVHQTDASFSGFEFY